MKVLITEEIAAEGIKKFFQAGYEVVQKKLKPEDLIKEIRSYDALIVRSSTKVSAELIEAAENLKIIGRAGTGFDNIDIEATTKRGIVVKIAPGGNVNSVAEFTIGLMIALSRNIFQSLQSLKMETWKKKEYLGSELQNKKLGVIGCGRIGRRVAEIASQGFRMKVDGYDIMPSEDSIINFVNLDSLLMTSDYITLHLPKQTFPIIGKEELQKMKKTAFLINNSRGGNIDEEALYEALRENWIAGAAIDVFQKEGKDGEVFKNRLFEFENFIGTSHIGALTEEAQEKVGTEIANVVIEFLEEGNFKNAVNLGKESDIDKSSPTNNLFVLHDDRPGMFSKITQVFGEHDINIIDMPSRAMGEGKAMTIFRVRKEFSPELIEEIKALEGIENVSK